MFGISIPPLPQLTDLAAYGLAIGSLSVGAVMLIWGRHMGRAFLCASGMAIGLALAGPIALQFGLNIVVVRLAGAAVLGLLALLAARIIWALLAGAMFGAIAEMVVLAGQMRQMAPEQQPLFLPVDQTLAAWMTEFGRFLLDGVAGLWAWNPSLVLVAIVPAAAVPLAVALSRDKLARIFMTSLIGAAGPVAGAILALGQVRASFWDSAAIHWYVPVSLIAVAMALGVAVQYRGAIRQDRADQEQEDEASDEDQDEPPAKPGKKKKKKQKKK